MYTQVLHSVIPC